MATKNEPDQSPKPFSLFRNQVAGHFPMLSHKGTVCKPLNEDEHRFYSHIPEHMPQILPYIPKYYGTIDLPQERLKVPNSQTDADALAASGRVNTWALHCQLKRKKKLINQKRYLVLEDLTHTYKRPCILDLKLGTRQHGVGEPPAKIASKTRKCRESTSLTLGLRLGGMQVYLPGEGRYVYRDKYFGRNLSEDGLKQTLREFFDNGTRLRIGVLNQLLHRIEEVRDFIQEHSRARFYSSSLLLVYEGFLSEEEYRTVQIRTPTLPTPSLLTQKPAENNGKPLAPSTSASSSRRESEPTAHGGVMTPNTQGNALVEASGSPQLEQPAPSADASAPSDLLRVVVPEAQEDESGVSKPVKRHKNADTTPTLSDTTPPHQAWGTTFCPQRSGDQSSLVDVRIIDFAHFYQIPLSEQIDTKDDDGMLVGFRSLIELFAQFANGPHESHIYAEALPEGSTDTNQSHQLEPIELQS